MAIGSSSQRPHRSEPRVQLACPRVARLTVCSRRVKTSLDTSISYWKQHGPCAYSVHPKHTHRDLSISTPTRSGRSRLHPVPPKMALPRGVQDAGDAAPQPLSRPRVLMGTRLPPYGQNTERAKAWGMACMRHSERSLSHDIAQERAVKMAEELAAAAAQAPGRLSVCARVPLQHALAAGRLGRASSSNVSRRSWDKVTAY